jgi:AraC-like DNA-binding protein
MTTDNINQLLHHLKLDGMYYSRTTMGGTKWGIDLPPFAHTSMFHIVTSGQCHVLINGQQTELSAGDLVFISRACGHQLVARPDNACTGLFELPIQQVSEHYETIEVDASTEPVTRMLCGVVRISHPAGERLINDMPDMIHIKRDDHLFGDMLGELVRLVITEASGNYLGGETVITRLADVLVIQAIRTWVEQQGEAGGRWLNAIKDEHIGRALGQLHAHPEKAWTIEKLGRATGMSRTALANRFTQLVGQTVFAYLTEWRMNLAVMAIQSGERVNADFVLRLGYQSEAAFRRAFKKTMGFNVSAVKTRHTEQSAAHNAAKHAPDVG